MTRFDDFEFILNVDMRREVAVSYSSIHREKKKVKGAEAVRELEKERIENCLREKKSGILWNK